ncbi:MAG: VanZ family protein [Calditrichaeota bacterium]|nr:MAG: VanZ family protein [Calditrichota bacterium]MBL1204327.1 VanZ family protein [Calditrichota bacterium]NOG44156.1 VanZ family protein [Calditrichota bacterium]
MPSYQINMILVILEFPLAGQLIKYLLHAFENSFMLFENNSRQDGSFKLLGTALFAYMLIIILVITLAPFRYHVPQKLAIFWFWDVKEVLQNIFLFTPFGFLIHSIIGEKSRFYLAKVYLLGLALSSFIEFNQFFIYTRMTSLIDIAANSFGSLVGAFFYVQFKKRLSKASGKIILEIPLMNLLFLLIPLLWLSSLAIGKEVQRIWLILPLGLMGAILISEIYLNRIYSKTYFNRILFFLFFFAWFIISTFPALVEFPKTILAFCLICVAFIAVRFLLQKQKMASEQRFELRTLIKIVPLYCFYIIILNRWPIRSFDSNYSFSFVQPELFSTSDLDFIIRTIQLFSSFTIVGYTLYQYINRRKPRNITAKLIFSLLAISMIIEMPRGFNPSQVAVFTNIFFNFFWGLFGALIYILQLHYFKSIQNEKKEVQLELDFDTKSIVRRKRAS